MNRMRGMSRHRGRTATGTNACAVEDHRCKLQKTRQK